MTSDVRRASRMAFKPPAAPRSAALVLLASAQLMLVLDVTVVNVALPDIGAALHLPQAWCPG